MPSLALSRLASVLGRRVPLRGPARLLFSSYARTRHRPAKLVGRLATATGDVFDVDLSSFLEWRLWAFGSYESHFLPLPASRGDIVAVSPATVRRLSGIIR
jgi:hypothetical protein